MKKKLLNRLCAAVSAVIMAVTTYGVAPTFATEASTEGSIINIMPLVDFNDWTDETVAAGTQYSGNSKPAGEVFFAMNNPGTVSIKSRGTGDKYLVNGIAEFSYMRSDNASTLGNADALSDGEQMVFSFETFSGTGKSSSVSIRMDDDNGPTNLFSTTNNTLNLYNAVAHESSDTKGSVIGTYTMPDNQWVKVDLVYTKNGTILNGSTCDSLVVYINNKTIRPVCAGGAVYTGKVIPMTGSILDSTISAFTFARGLYDNVSVAHYVDGATYKKSGKVITTVVPMINFDSYETAEIPVGDKDDNADVTQWSTMQPIFSVQNDSEYAGKIYVTVAIKDGTTDRYYSGAYNEYDTGTSDRVEVKYSADKNGRLKNIPLSEGEKLEYGISVHSDKSFWMYNRTDGDADTSGILNYLFRVDGGKLYIFDGNKSSNDERNALGYITLSPGQWVDLRIVYTAGDGVDNNLSSGGTDDTVEVYLGSDVQTLTANRDYIGNGSVSTDGINKLAVDYLGSSTSRLSFDPNGTFDNFSVTKYADKAEEKEEVNPSLLGIDHQPNDFTYFHSERVMLGSMDYEFASIMASSGNSYVIEPADKKNQDKGDKLILTRVSDEAGENSLVNLNVPTYGVTTDLVPLDKEFKYFMIDGLFHFTSRDIGGPFIVMGDDISTEGAYIEAVTLSDGKLIAGSGKKEINTTAWHHLQMIVNIEDGYYDVIVDGELLCQNVAIGDDIEILSNISMTINEGIGTLEIREMEVTGLSKEPSLTRNDGVYDFDIVHTSQFIDDNLTRTYLSDKVVFHGDGDMTYNRGTKTEYDKGSFVYDDEERELYVPLSVINEQLDADVVYVNNQWVKGDTVLAEKEAESGINVIMPMIDFDDWQSETIEKEAIYSGNEELTGQVFYAMNKGGKIDVRSRKTGDKYIVNGLSEFAYRSDENSDNFKNLTALDPGEQMVISFETNPAIVGFASANIRSNLSVDDGPTTIYSIESNMLNIYDGIPEYIKEDEHITSGTIIGKYTLPKNRWSEVNLVYTRLGTTKDGVPCDSIEVYVDGKLVKLTAATDMPINSMVVPLSQSFIDAKALRFTFDRGAYDNLGIKIYRDGRVFSTDEEENTKYYKGEPLAPVKTIAEALGYTCEFYKYGKMVMIAEGDAELPESNDLDAQPWFDEQYYSKGWCVHPQTVLSDAQEIANFVFYDRPLADEFETSYNAFISNAEANNKETHPRLVLTPEKVATIKERIAEDSKTTAYAGVYTNAIAKIESDANEVINENYLVKYEFEDNYRTLAAARKFEYNMIKLGLAYQLTSDDNLKKKCAVLAVSNMKEVVKFPDFNYGHVIDAGEWLYGCAIGFDWFYDKFTEEERAEIAEGILEIGLRPMNRTFYAMLPSALNKDSQGQGNMGNANNFVKWKSNFVPYTQHGLVTASLVLADYEPDVCFDTLEKAIRNWEYSNLGLYPAGGWLEGKSYLSVVHNNTAAAFSSLLNVMGDEYNVLEATGVEESLDKVIQLTSQTGSFVYADENVYGGGMSGVPVSASFYADYYGRDDIERIRQWRYRYGDINAWYFMDTIFYQHFDDQQLIQKAKSYTSLDTINYTEGTEIVTIHEDWAAGASLFFALAGGPTRHYHFHNDGGDFSLCMDGARWSYEMGTSDYNIGTNYSKYAGRAEGHNTLVINPDDDPAAGESVDNSYTWTAQKEQSFAAVMDYGEIEGGAYTTLDMSQLYEDAGAVRVHRGAWIDENYDVVTLRDEIEFAEDEEFDGWWFMHTKADYERINDNTILLRMMNKYGFEEYLQEKGNLTSEDQDDDGDVDEDDQKIWWNLYAPKLYVQVDVDGADSYNVQWMDPNPLESSPQTKSDPTNKKGVHKIGIYYQGSGEIDITVRMSNTLGDTIDTTPISQWLISDLYKEGDDIKINLLGDYYDNYRLFVAEHKDGKFVAANTGEATYDAARGQYKCTVTPITEDADECVIYLWNEESYAPIRKLVRIRMSDLVIIE